MHKATVVPIVALLSTLTFTGLLRPVSAQDEHQHHVARDDDAVLLSPELASLLSEEMLAIEKGLGVLMTAMASGNWPLVAETAERIEKSYILAQQLTPEQLQELGRALPERFKALDSAFHGAAGKLSSAAREHNPELALFHSYKLMEACVECHATYAQGRFPGFAAAGAGHGHH
jgi:hypothetical protein